MCILIAGLAAQALVKTGDAALGTRKYADYQTPQFCGTACHTDIYRQWQQAMMSQAYTHHWDEIEYFKLAVPHAEKDSVVAGVKAGCNGCHAPIAFLAGDVPPPLPDKNSRANESVSCEVCHTVTGFAGDTPHNFNFDLRAGQDQVRPARGQELARAQPGQVRLPGHGRFLRHLPQRDEPLRRLGQVDPPRVEGRPLRQAGRQVPRLSHDLRPGKTAAMGNAYPDARQHLFHGAHDPGKVRGTIELRIHPDIREAVPGDPVKFTVALFNQKTGHKFPSGSVEDRIVWMHVEAVDAKGTVYHLPVDKKGFAGEEYTIGARHRWPTRTWASP